ncbi:MAG: SusF/SusE family outer membrane protein [Proteiniphilum sp.]|nr:SusF/SusE family outer membrane protein [Proteiniphilum sp.]
MKTKNCKTIYRLLLLFSLSFFISCNEKEENVTSVINDNITTGNPLELTVSSENVTLNQDNWDKEAVSFTWKPGRSRGENRGLTYLFKMDVAGKNFTTSIPTEEIWEEEINNGVYTKSYTHKQLNDLISKQWGNYLGGEIKLSARVIAKVISKDKYVKPDYSTLDFSVKSYVPSSVPLFLIGDATPAHWELSSAIPMIEVINGDLYKWRGNLVNGEFKFLFSRESWLPSYNKGENSNTIVKRTSEDEPDDLFKIFGLGYEKSKPYSIVIHRYENRIDFSQVRFPKIIFVGDATGWSFQEMDWNPEEPDVFETTLMLGEGTFKFLDDADWGANIFKPTMENAPLSHTEVNYTSEYHPDWKWMVRAEDVGLYKISLDTRNLKMTVKKLN